MGLRRKCDDLPRADLSQRLEELEQTTEALALSHDTVNRNTPLQVKQLFDTIRDLMTPPNPYKRPIGFDTPDDKGTKGSG